MELEQKLPLQHYRNIAIRFSQETLCEMLPYDVLLVNSTESAETGMNFGATITGTHKDLKKVVSELQASVYHLIKPENFQVIGIGRTSNSPIYLQHEEISRTHAYIRDSPKVGGLKEILDQSKNGTWLNENRLVHGEWTLLRSSSQLIFGGKDSGIKAMYFSAEDFVRFLQLGYQEEKDE